MSTREGSIREAVDSKGGRWDYIHGLEEVMIFKLNLGKKIE